MKKDDAQPEEKPKKNLLKGLVKWVLILGAFIFVMLTVLTNIGGSSPVMREALEDLIGEKTGMLARIAVLNHMNFFPNIGIDIEYLELFPKSEDGKQDGDTVVLVGKAKIAFGFLDLVFGDGDMKAFEIEDLMIKPGIVLPKQIIISRAAIEETQDGKAALNVTGKIGEAPLKMQISFEAIGKPGRKTYKVGKNRDFSASLSDISLTGHMKNKRFGGVHIENAALKQGDKTVITGNFDLKHNSDRKWALKGETLLHPFKSTLETDLEITGGATPELKGKLHSGKLITGDLSPDEGRLRNAIDRLSALLGKDRNDSKPIDLHNIDSAIDLDVTELYAGTALLGSVKAPMSIKNAQLKIGPLTGNISGGALEGGLTLKTKESPAHLETRLKVKNLDYGAFQKQFKKDAEIEGKGDLLLNLSSKGKTAQTLQSNLTGKLTFVGGSARLKSNILNLWGGGLLNALLPDFSGEKNLDVNCTVLDMDIKGKIAETDVLFVDTKSITLTGKGQYKIDSDRLDLKLTPKTKDVAIGDIATGVHLSGPLSNLSVSPSALDISKKIGGLLLGAVNPAFYAITLVDLGLNEQHPCKEFVIEKENLPPPELAPAPENTEPPAQQTP